MPGFLQYYLPSVLLFLTCLFSDISSQRNQGKPLEVPLSSIIHINDGRQRYFNLTSEFIAENPLVKIESSEQAAKYYVTVMESYLHAKKHCPEPITIAASNAANTPIICHGTGSSITVMIAGNFSMQFKSNTVNHTPTEVHIIRYQVTNSTEEACQNQSDHKCGFRCFGSDAVCDGLKHCRDGSDERDCSPPTSSSTYDVTTTKVISTTPAGTRRCDLPGAIVKDPPEDDFKKTWSVVVYCTGIIIGTVFCSFVIGFCFMHPNPDDEEVEERDRREANEDGQRRLDPLLDHPPSYEDVMNMDLSAAPQRQIVPKPQTSSDSP